MQENNQYDAIIVGAGISGLLMALALTKEGKKTLIIEKSGELGGNCRTYEVDGYRIDTGPHAANTPAFIYGSGDAGNAGTYIGSDASSEDLHVLIQKLSLQSLAPLPLPWTEGLDTGTDIYQFKAYSSFNGYSVPNFNKPVIISLPYDPKKASKNLKSLKIGYLDKATNSWKILNSPMVINQSENEISTTTTFFTDFVVIYAHPNIQSASVQGAETAISPKVANFKKQNISGSSSTTGNTNHQSISPNNHKTCLLFICW